MNGIAYRIVGGIGNPNVPNAEIPPSEKGAFFKRLNRSPMPFSEIPGLDPDSILREPWQEGFAYILWPTPPDWPWGNQYEWEGYFVAEGVNETAFLQVIKAEMGELSAIE